jgi:hypothetical protein
MKNNLFLVTTTLIARAKATIAIIIQVPSLANYVLLHERKRGQPYLLLIGIIMNMWQQ